MPDRYGKRPNEKVFRLKGWRRALLYAPFSVIAFMIALSVNCVVQDYEAKFGDAAAAESRKGLVVATALLVFCVLFSLVHLHKLWRSRWGKTEFRVSEEGIWKIVPGVSEQYAQWGNLEEISDDVKWLFFRDGTRMSLFYAAEVAPPMKERLDIVQCHKEFRPLVDKINEHLLKDRRCAWESLPLVLGALGMFGSTLAFIVQSRVDEDLRSDSSSLANLVVFIISFAAIVYCTIKRIQRS